MAFHEVRLPEDVERGAAGGPRFSTSVVALSSGYESRVANWSRPRLAWDVGYGVQSYDDLRDVIAFFYARMGRAHGFRFKDWTDFAVESIQQIGVGDGANKVFPVFKRYSSGGVDLDRPLTKLVSGTLKVYLNGVLQPSGYSANLNTGVITFTVAPAVAVSVAVTCEFDVPVRFDTDELKITAEAFEVGSVPSIPIVELRV